MMEEEKKTERKGVCVILKHQDFWETEHRGCSEKNCNTSQGGGVEMVEMQSSNHIFQGEVVTMAMSGLRAKQQLEQQQEVLS